MRSHSIAFALTLSLLAAAGAVGCFLKVSGLEHDAQWLMARSNAAADEYASSFDGSMADQELATFNQRREVLERAELWDCGRRGLILTSVLLALSAYGLYLRRRLHEQTVDSGLPFHEGELAVQGPPTTEWTPRISVPRP